LPVFRQNRWQDSLAVVIRRNLNHTYTRSLGLWHPRQLFACFLFHCAPSKMPFLLFYFTLNGLQREDAINDLHKE
jgi:hypothetical protein